MSADDYPPDVDGGVVHQPRCPFCLVEHYVLNVPAISNGEVRCGRCGHDPVVYHRVADYVNQLRATRADHDARRPP